MIKELGAIASGRHLLGDIPQDWPLHGQSGDPGGSPTGTANQMLQNTMGDADKEYWAGDPDDPDDNGATFDAPYTTNKDGFGNTKHNPFSYGSKMPRESIEMSKETLKEFIREFCSESKKEHDSDCECKKCKDDLLLDEDELTPEETGEKEVKVKDEASALGGGMVRGHMGNRNREQKQEKVNQRSFGGGKYDI